VKRVFLLLAAALPLAAQTDVSAGLGTSAAGSSGYAGMSAGMFGRVEHAVGKLTFRSLGGLSNAHKAYVGSGWQWMTAGTADFNFSPHFSAIAGVSAVQQRNIQYHKAAMNFGGGARLRGTTRAGSGNVFIFATAPDVLSYNKVREVTAGLEMTIRQLIGRTGLHFEVGVSRTTFYQPGQGWISGFSTIMRVGPSWRVRNAQGER
jgi:hypothetical protein